MENSKAVMYVNFLLRRFIVYMENMRVSSTRWSESHTTHTINLLFSLRNMTAKVVIPVLKRTPSHEDVQGSTCIAPHILNLGTRRRCVISFTLQLFHPLGKSSWYPPTGGCTGHGASLDMVKIKISDPVGNWTLNSWLSIQPVAQSQCGSSAMG
jgi:hypothetical protein